MTTATSVLGPLGLHIAWPTTPHSLTQGGARTTSIGRGASHRLKIASCLRPFSVKPNLYSTGTERERNGVSRLQRPTLMFAHLHGGQQVFVESSKRNRDGGCQIPVPKILCGHHRSCRSRVLCSANERSISSKRCVRSSKLEQQVLARGWVGRSEIVEPHFSPYSRIALCIIQYGIRN